MTKLKVWSDLLLFELDKKLGLELAFFIVMIIILINDKSFDLKL